MTGSHVCAKLNPSGENSVEYCPIVSWYITKILIISNFTQASETSLVQRVLI